LPADLLAVQQAIAAHKVATAEANASIKPLLDPAPLVAGLAPAIEVGLGQVQAVGADAAAVSKAVLATSDEAAALNSKVRAALADLSSLPGDLHALLFDVKIHLEGQAAFAQALQAVAAKAASASDVVADFGAKLVSAVQTADGQATIQTLRPAAVGQIEALRSQLSSALQAEQARFTGAGAALTIRLDQVLLSVDGRITALRASLESTAKSSEALSVSVGKTGETAAQQYGKAQDALVPAAKALAEPVAASQAKLKNVGTSVSSASQAPQDSLKKITEAVSVCEAKLDSSVAAIAKAVDAFEAEVKAVKDVLAQINTKADKAKASLRALSDNFTPVGTMIGEAVSSIEAIKADIPSMISSAKSSLTAASGELDQAAGLCTSAIEVCTRYMMRAPMLVPARLLFMGVKAMIPGIKSGISAAIGALVKAESGAVKLLDLAISGVKGLTGVLTQIVNRVTAAVAVMEGLITSFQTALASALTAMESVIAKLSAAVDDVPPKIDAFRLRLNAAIEGYLAKAKPKPGAKPVQTQVEGVKDSAFGPVNAKLDGTQGNLGIAIADAKTQVPERAQELSSSLGDMGAQLAGLPELSLQAGESFKSLMQRAKSRLSALNASEAAQSQAAMGRINAFLDASVAQVSKLHAAASARQTAESSDAAGSGGDEKDGDSGVDVGASQREQAQAGVRVETRAAPAKGSSHGR
jgi:hypothetical protein